MARIGTRQEFDKVRLYITALPLLSLNADRARRPSAPRPKQRAEPPDRTNLIQVVLRCIGRKKGCRGLSCEFRKRAHQYRHRTIAVYTAYPCESAAPAELDTKIAEIQISAPHTDPPA